MAYSAFVHFQILLLPHTAHLSYEVVMQEIANTGTFTMLLSLVILGLTLVGAGLETRMDPRLARHRATAPETRQRMAAGAASCPVGVPSIPSAEGDLNEHPFAS